MYPGSAVARDAEAAARRVGKKFAVAMFLCFSQHSQFCILRPHMVDGQFTLDHTATVYAPEVGWKIRLCHFESMGLISSLRERHF